VSYRSSNDLVDWGSTINNPDSCSMLIPTPVLSACQAEACVEAEEEWLPPAECCRLWRWPLAYVVSIVLTSKRKACRARLIGAHILDLRLPRFDRDLSVAGRVLVRDGSKVDSKLIRIDRPILRIPTLAIHLSSDEERGGFGPNLQSHLPPVMATEIKARLLEEATKGAEGAGESTRPPRDVGSS
jgi:hypothetical protein